MLVAYPLVARASFVHSPPAACLARTAFWEGLRVEPASSFLKINGIVMASEDEVILPPADTINTQQKIKAFGVTTKVRG